MASLVADYSDSSSESESSTYGENPTAIFPQNNKDEPHAPAGNNYFSASKVTDEEDTSEEESTNCDEAITEQRERLPNPLAQSQESALSNPLSGHGGVADKRLSGPRVLAPGQSGSVFVTAFHKAEEAKSSILEQHVKMTSAEQKAQQADKRNICKNFNKGKCRFGHRCKFLHSSDVAVRLGDHHSSDTPAAADGTFPTQQPGGYHGGDGIHRSEEEVNAQPKRKSRPGVTDTLKPAKRAKGALDKARKYERPWTVHQ